MEGMRLTKRIVTLAVAAGVAALLTGCGAKKIVIESYTAPKEYKKIEGIVSDGNEAGKGGKFLTIAINPEVASKVQTSDMKSLQKMLVADVKEKITETNFITLHPLYDLSAIGLNMEIMDYKFDRGPNDISAMLRVNFVINRGVTEYYAKTYSAKEIRYSKSGQGLPEKGEILSLMSMQCAKSFIKDISPLKTRQLREFKSMPSELEYVLDFAMRKNYEGAIKAMENYSGDKDMEFYYNLAVLYEALASEHEDLILLKKANEYYEQSMAKGGTKDEVVISAKARFDNFYRLLSRVLNQESANVELEKKMQEEFGISY